MISWHSALGTPAPPADRPPFVILISSYAGLLTLQLAHLLRPSSIIPHLIARPLCAHLGSHFPAACRLKCSDGQRRWVSTDRKQGLRMSSGRPVAVHKLVELCISTRAHVTCAALSLKSTNFFFRAPWAHDGGHSVSGLRPGEPNTCSDLAEAT